MENGVSRMVLFKVVSLFTGAGGLDLGFEQTGRYRIVFANEVYEPALKTYSRNLGLKLSVCEHDEEVEAEEGTALVCDVAQVDFSSLRDFGIDVVIGGPPCQDFSIVRGPSWDRRGIEVKGGKLYAHFVRALVSLQPKMFVFENVPGLVSANKGRAYTVILDDFSNLKLRWPEVRRAIPDADNGDEIEDYEIIFSRVADFSKLGVPQKRERLIIIGVRKDLVKKGFMFPRRIKNTAENVLEGRKQLFKKYPLTPIEVFEGRTLDELDSRYKEVMKQWERVWEEVDSERVHVWKKRVWDKLTFNVIEDYLKINNIMKKSEEEVEAALKQHKAVLEELGYYGVPVSALELPDLTTELPKERRSVAERVKRIPPGENYKFVIGTRWQVEGKGISLIYKRVHPLKLSYTIVARGGGGTRGYHYERSRVTLTLREKARLQTFPDYFLFHGRKPDIRAQIGEAVPPLAGKRIAEVVAVFLEEVS